tara:strand:+ start:651 stop:890 length:240 start_codon:yes stop_codon:yes gene_type:complete
MKKLFLLSVLFIFACSDADQNCFTIIDKIISENEFVFVGDFDTSNTDTNGSLNGYADINLNVSQEVFNSYNEGDEYCYD